MTAEEFVYHVKANPSRFGGEAAVGQLGVLPKDGWEFHDWFSFPGWFKGTEWVSNTVFSHMNFTGRMGLSGPAEEAKTKEFQAFATDLRQHPPMSLTSADWNAPILRLEPRAMLGNYYTKIFIPGAENRAKVRNMIRQSVRLRREVFEAAAAAMAAGGITPGSYGAIHNRQGDWKDAHWGPLYLDPSKPELFTNDPENLKFLQSHPTIYFASNPEPGLQVTQMNNIWYPAIQARMPMPAKIVTLKGPVYEAAKAIVGHIEGWQGIIEMLICGQAEEFLGTWGSTFTGYIHRIRGYLPGVRDKRLLFYDRGFNRDTEGLPWPSWSAAKTNSEIDLGTEWKEGWEDNEE